MKRRILAYLCTIRLFLKDHAKNIYENGVTDTSKKSANTQKWTAFLSSYNEHLPIEALEVREVIFWNMAGDLWNKYLPAKMIAYGRSES